MTKQEWMTDVVSRIPEDNKILVWAIMSEDDEAYHLAIGEDATGGQQMLLMASLIKHIAKNLQTTPDKAVKAALAYDAMKEALKKAGVAEDEAEDEADDEE